MHKKIISVVIFLFSAVVFSQEPNNLGSLFYKEVTADIETEPVFVADDAAAVSYTHLTLPTNREV